MANECSNFITIKGDKDLIQIFADSYLKKEENGNYSLDFNIIAPIPDDCENDYDFRIHNWGNRWDGTNGYVTIYDDNEIFIDVTTAWSPCEPITKRLISLCPGLYIYHEYYEGGCGFIGWIEHQPDEDPEDFEQIDYNYEDKEEYWYAVFDKEYETIDWLAECIEDSYSAEELTKQDYEELNEILEVNELRVIVELCVEKGVL